MKSSILNRVTSLAIVLAIGWPVMIALAKGAQADPVEYQVVLDTIHKGYDGKYCWVYPRAGIVPRGNDRPPAVVLTMQRLLMTGSDVFYAVNEMRTENMERTWIGPYKHAETLGRRDEGDNAVAGEERRQTCYSVYNAARRTWTPWRTLSISDSARLYNESAGSVQRFDLPNGDILLPTYFKGRGETDYRVVVLRCCLDGTTLRVAEIGNEVSIEGGRGFAEPSITRFGERYFLTLRNNDAGYVAVSRDGLNFGPPRKWTWDDETDLGSYNTQQHWVTHRDGLFLVYTRRGASNDHVMRNRVPLFIAQVDPENLTVVRATGRILMPERGARLGNFGVTTVSPDETWATSVEWMQKVSPVNNWAIPVDNARGADNSVYVARIMWKNAQ